MILMSVADATERSTHALVTNEEVTERAAIDAVSFTICGATRLEER